MNVQNFGLYLDENENDQPSKEDRETVFCGVSLDNSIKELILYGCNFLEGGVFSILIRFFKLNHYFEFFRFGNPRLFLAAYTYSC